MVRRARTQPVTAQMYRHFAVLTVAVTLAVGVFADGENRKAAASGVQRAAPPAAPVKLIRHDRPALSSFASDGMIVSDFGKPMDVAGATAQDGIIPDGSIGAGGAVPSGINQFGVSLETWARMTDEQRKALIAKHKAELRAIEAPDRAAQVSALLAASRDRSGAPTEVED